MTITLDTKDVLLRSSELSFAQRLLDYYLRNAAFLEAYEPKREAAFYTLETQQEQLRQEIADTENKTLFRFYIFSKSDPETIIGSVSLSNIVWGSFLSCFLGYKLDEKRQNQGYMTQAIQAVTQFAFGELGLHRIEANVMPGNMPSRRVLEKCGFREEGLSPQYMKIKGVWEDHLHIVLLNDAV